MSLALVVLLLMLGLTLVSGASLAEDQWRSYCS